MGKAMTTLQRGWSLDNSRWGGIPQRMFEPGRWTRVRLNLDDFAVVPEATGVYAICAAPPGRSLNQTFNANDLFGTLYTAIYTGQGLLRDRFRNHSGTNPMEPIQDARRCFPGRLEFWFLRCDSDEMDEFESALQSCLGPTANRNQKHFKGTVQDPVDAFQSH